MPGVRVSTQAEKGSPGGTVEASVKQAARIARRHDHRGLVVFVDEFQDMAKADRRSLLIALQHFDGAPKGHPVAIVAAGLPSLPAAVTDAATFGERTDFCPLQLLTEVAVVEALKLPALVAGVAWEQSALEAASEVTSGYPHEVQLLGEAAWTVARPDPGDTITLGHLKQGVELAEQRMDYLFAARIAKTTREQHRLLTAMATLGDSAVTRAAVAGELGVTTVAISRTRQELIDRGMIEPAGHGLLRFTVPGFVAYLRAEAARNRE